MSSLQIIAFLIAVADLALCGLISNGFIVTVAIIQWTKRRSLSSNEQLLMILGISNFCITVLLAASLIGNQLNNRSYLLLQIIFRVAIFLLYSRFWLTAWLCVFYCLKIVNSTYSAFLWCKLRISQLIPHLLAASLVVSFFLSVFSILHLPVQSQSNTTACTANMTQAKMGIDFSRDRILLLSLGSGCPLLVVSLCSILIVASLCRHICRMRSAASSFKSHQTEAHIKAAGTVVFLLILYLLFYVAESLPLIVGFEGSDLFELLVLMVYAPAQATILVLVNPKLKQAAARVLSRRTP
ncbi:taste receptor type 2 member 4-like [Varanus komodoensis]|uniref:taste receptor type 2 member 4-like n=1 Tax=Varanus komodoensis TaxID=61221 RepID=UPI001CF76FD7|nr:taste receptor type 2 member 4-like [Varanus komodoensis]